MYPLGKWPLAPSVSDSEEELAEPVGFHPVVGEGEPEGDEGPEHEGEIFDVSPTFYWAPSVTNASFAHQDFTNLSKHSRHKREEEATSISQD